ncbi:MAG: peptide chain release factor N(5)-glutamine methyltransferase [Lachnospiraceae bacterium]|nr:peptide chain release factor N(5)-glutamine methyltransferase [Lachnospiraceae bacterium]
MKYRELLQEGERQLEAAGNPEAKVDAWYLLEFVTVLSRQEYFLQMEQAVDDATVESYRQALAKRMEHVPLQYITGFQEFMGLNFLVNPSVLIPRQDTETLVEQALSVIESGDTILDMCTGSGCILISLLKMKQDCRGVGVDISEKAIETARENARMNEVEATWLCSDMFTEVSGKYDVMVSNPPYIATSVIETLMPEVVQFEPYGALDGHEDGLFFYRRLVEQSGDYLTDRGYLLFEIGYDQGEAVADLMKQAGYKDVTVVKDYCENDRVVMGHL